MIANFIEVEDGSGEAVFQVGGEVCDLVSQIDELGFEGRLLVEKVSGQLRMGGRAVITGVLDDAFADGEGQVETREGGVAFFKAGDDAEGVEVVVKAEVVGAEGLVEGVFSGVAKRRVTDVVDQSESLGERGIESQGSGGGAGDLGYLKGVGEAAAGVVAFEASACDPGENLSFAGEATEGLGVQDAADVTNECGAIGMGVFGIVARGERIGFCTGDGETRRQPERSGRRHGLRLSRGLKTVHAHSLLGALEVASVEHGNRSGTPASG